MPRMLFRRINDGIMDELFFQQRSNAARELLVQPLQNIVYAQRVLTFGEAADRADEFVRISGSTT